MALGKQAKPLRTNGFAVDMPGAFQAVVRDFPDPSLVKAERERLSGFWFLHWTDGKLYHLRLAAGGPNLDGTPVTVSTSDHPWLLRSRLDDAISQAFPKYEPQRLRPFTFLAQKSELLAEAAEEARITHPLLNTFSVTPRYVLNAKIYEPREGEPRVGVFVTVNMKYAIDSGMAELQAAGVDLKGLHVVRRHQGCLAALSHLQGIPGRVLPQSLRPTVPAAHEGAALRVRLRAGVAARCGRQREVFRTIRNDRVEEFRHYPGRAYRD